MYVITLYVYFKYIILLYNIKFIYIINNTIYYITLCPDCITIFMFQFFVEIAGQKGRSECQTIELRCYCKYYEQRNNPETIIPILLLVYIQLLCVHKVNSACIGLYMYIVYGYRIIFLLSRKFSF